MKKMRKFEKMKKIFFLIKNLKPKNYKSHFVKKISITVILFLNIILN